MTDKAVPTLPSLDLARTRKFYRYFGFEPVGGEPGPDDHWMRLKRGEVEIDFRLASVDYRSDEHILHQSVCLIRVADVAAWHAVFANTRMGWKWIFPSLNKPRTDIWGGLPAFSVTDKDGNLIWVVESEKAEGPEPVEGPPPQP
ncbi:MAG TPA: VOC family protein [Allosphingosinicella sp.]|nr:VOC family protein [Allosphingosinicella sp.]